VTIFVHSLRGGKPILTACPSRRAVFPKKFGPIFQAMLCPSTGGHMDPYLAQTSCPFTIAYFSTSPIPCHRIFPKNKQSASLQQVVSLHCLQHVTTFHLPQMWLPSSFLRSLQQAVPLQHAVPLQQAAFTTNSNNIPGLCNRSFLYNTSFFARHSLKQTANIFFNYTPICSNSSSHCQLFIWLQCNQKHTYIPKTAHSNLTFSVSTRVQKEDIYLHPDLEFLT